MPKLFEDENVGVFMNIDERQHFALTAHVRGKTHTVTTTWKKRREVSLFIFQNSTRYTLIK
jgi:hypothetical protein